MRCERLTVRSLRRPAESPRRPPYLAIGCVGPVFQGDPFIVRKFLLIPLVLVIYVLAGGPTALAHSGKQSYVYLGFYDSEVDGRVEIPVRDLGPVLGIDFGTNRETITAALEANRDEIISYVDSHMALESVDGDEWALEYGAVSVLNLGANSYLLFPFDVAEDFDEAPREVVVEFDAIIEVDPDKDALLHIENDVRSGVVKNESDPILGFSTGQTVQTVALETAPTLTQLGAVRGLGTDGVRDGVVHVLFVGVLMAPVALLARRQGFRDPAPSTLAVVRRAAVVLAAFGGGALVTLWLTGLGVIDLSSRSVVAATSVSLLAVSVWAVLAWLRPPLTAQEPAVIAVLGMLQGLGFGTTFVNDSLDRSRTVLSLVGFSLGVAAAVLVVASLALLPMALLRRTPLAPVVLVMAAAIGGAYASAWIFEGLLDADWSLKRWANPWGVWPRNLVLALVGAAIAAGLRALFAARGALRPVGADPDPSNDRPAERETVASP